MLNEEELKERVKNYTDEEPEAIITKAIANKDTDLMNDIMADLRVKSSYYQAKRSEVEKAFHAVRKDLKKKADKEKKASDKAKDKEQFPDYIDIFVKFNEQTYSVKVPFKAILKTLRSILAVNFPKVFASEKKMKKLSYNYKDQVMNDHARREFGSKEKGKGWGIKDGDTIHVSVLGQGGGKRGASSVSAKTKEDYMNEIELEIETFKICLEAIGVSAPLIEQTMKKVIEMKEAISKNHDTVFGLLLAELSDETVKMLQKQVLASSSKPLERSKKITSIIFQNELKGLEEMRNQRAKAVEILSLATHLMIVSQFGDRYCNISWESFSEVLVKKSEPWNEATIWKGFRVPTAPPFTNRLPLPNC